ncbi:MAG: ATP-binding cassette domain-containing protein [Alphaproteobacteria bacterium]|nr:ATP-binding cassette domain-containing protein [Alphaproteobacteria bacterium]
MSEGLVLEGLAVQRGGARVLDEVSLAVAPGEIVALLGGNGAGKSTLLETVLGLHPPQAGRLRWAGQDLARLPVEVRSRAGVGYVPEGRRVFAGLTVRETLEAALDASRSERQRRVGEMLDSFPALAARAGHRAWSLSGGEQQMLALARALMPRPRLLLLDEPTLGLAPAIVEDLWARLAGLAASGTAVLLAEQKAATALSLAGRGVVLRRGRIVAEAPAAALLANAGLADLMAGA